MPSLRTPTEWDIENNQDTVKEITETPSVEFVVGVEVPNVINVALQVVDGQGVALAQQLAFMAWLSDTAGAAVTASAPSVGTSVGTDGTIIAAHTAETFFELLTDVAGVIDLDIEEAAVDTWFLNVRLPGGAIVSSAAITFA